MRQGRPWWLTIQPIKRACAAVSPRALAAPAGVTNDKARTPSRVRLPPGMSWVCRYMGIVLEVAGVVVAAAPVEFAAVPLVGAVEFFFDQMFERLVLLLSEIEPVFFLPLVTRFVAAGKPLPHFGARGLAGGNALVALRYDLFAP